MTQEAQPSKEAMEAGQKISLKICRDDASFVDERWMAAIIDASHAGLREELERAKQKLKEARKEIEQLSENLDGG